MHVVYVKAAFFLRVYLPYAVFRKKETRIFYSVTPSINRAPMETIFGRRLLKSTRIRLRQFWHYTCYPYARCLFHNAAYSINQSINQSIINH